ncbi:MAG: metallophosphoesterase [Opitutales bacterium]|nr:metallophosphoesterase [Opitutales bacterium]
MPLNTAVEIETDTCLLLFDPHENTAWLNRVLAREADRCSHVLLGGDYFDPRGDEIDGAGGMARRLLELRERFGERLTLLLGNHDIPYLWAMPWVRRQQSPRRASAPPFLPADFSPSKAKRIGKVLDDDFWRECRLFQKVNGWLISHAGVVPAHWPVAPSPEAALESLDRRARHALAHLRYEADPLLLPGAARGGDAPAPGLTWADWYAEFEDALPYPQIVGHTSRHNRARQRGRSWCLDGARTLYGRLHRNGRLEVEEA